MGIVLAAAGSSTTASRLGPNPEESVKALSLALQRLSDFAVEAAELDELAAAVAERAAAVAERERLLKALAATVAKERTRQIARATKWDEDERAVAQHRAALAKQESILASREAVVEKFQEELLEQARALEERAARFHWRWFLRVWAWRPRIRDANARVCEVFFVPSASGYKLLEQTGLAVTQRARIRGLLDEDTTYVVTKLAQLPFDGRWCAYFELDEVPGGTSDE